MSKSVKKMIGLLSLLLVFLIGCTNGGKPTGELEYDQLVTIKLNEVKPFEINQQQDLVGFQFKVPKTGDYVVDYLVTNVETTKEDPLSLIVEGKKIRALSLYQQVQRGDFSYHLKKGRMFYFAPKLVKNKLPVGSTGEIRVRALETINFDLPKAQRKLTLKVGEEHQIAYTMTVPEQFPSNQASFSKRPQDNGIELSTTGKLTAKKIGNYQVTIKQPLDAPFVDSRGRKLKSYQPISVKVIKGEKEPAPEPESASTLKLNGLYQESEDEENIALIWRDMAKNNSLLDPEQENLDVEDLPTYEVHISFDKNNFEVLLETNIAMGSYSVTDQTPDQVYFKVVEKEEQKVVNQSNVIEMKKGKEGGFEEVRIDSDGDGLTDDEEKIIGTAPSKADTDGDGLSDFEEIYVFMTDPLKKDSDGNGIDDGDEDFDQDGLTNLEELAAGTNPFSADSDNDGLSDGDEIKMYLTDPLNPDTDGDGVSDGLEIELGTNPLVPENEFKREITIKPENLIDKRVRPTVAMEQLTGEQAQKLNIREIGEGHPFLTPEIPGYYGGAFDFYVPGEFQEAVVTFEFEESKLNDLSFKPTLYYYNEEAELLEEVANQEVVGNQVIAKLSHFSTYLLLNKTEYDKVWQADILLPSESADGGIDLVFVVDESSSMRTNDPSFVRSQVIREFVKKIRPQDRVGIVGFNANARVYTGLTSNQKEIEEAIERITVRDWTNGSLGMKTGLDLFDKNNAKRLIFLTDGADNYHAYNYQELIDQANQQNIMIHTVGLGRRVNSKNLEKIALETKGKYFFADRAEGLFEEYDEIEKETEKLMIDANEDGLIDYYVEELFDGNLRLGNGQTLHAYFNLDPEIVTFEAFQKNKDFDDDGLINGEEIAIKTVTHEDRTRVYVTVDSSPFVKSTSGDGISDKDKEEGKKKWQVRFRDLAMFSNLSYVPIDHWEDQYEEEDYNYSKTKIGYPKLILPREKSKDKKASKGEFQLFGRMGESLEVRKDNRWVRDPKDNREEKIRYNWIFSYEFNADTFVNKKDKQIAITFQGTQGLGDVITDLYYFSIIPQEEEVKKYVQEIVSKYPGYKIYFTGHSLGGYLATVGAQTADVLGYYNQVERTAVFNGMGIPPIVPTSLKVINHRRNLTKSLRKYAGNDQLNYHNITGDIISKLGNNLGRANDYPPAPETKEFGSFLYQHSMINFFPIFETPERKAQQYRDKYNPYEKIEDYIWINGYQ